MSEDFSTLAFYEGTARLFPLPNVVLFPHVMLPLHIFEPRYRQLTTDALAGDRLLAMALLQQGWENDYEGRPALHPMVCVGKIIAEQRLEDGRFHILLRGLSRARIVREVDRDTLYRQAQLDLLQDQQMADFQEAAQLRHALIERVPSWFAAMGVALDQFKKLLESELTLGVLDDVFTFALPLPIDFKQQLLEELDVARRTRRLLDHLAENTPPKRSATGQKFPPEFSPN